MDVKKEYIVAARDQFVVAQRALVMAALALKESGGTFEYTVREVKIAIGDLAITVEILSDHLD